MIPSEDSATSRSTMTVGSPKSDGLARPVTRPSSSPTTARSWTSVAGSAARAAATTSATARSRSRSSGPVTRVTGGGQVSHRRSRYPPPVTSRTDDPEPATSTVPSPVGAPHERAGPSQRSKGARCRVAVVVVRTDRDHRDPGPYGAEQLWLLVRRAVVGNLQHVDPPQAAARQQQRAAPPARRRRSAAGTAPRCGRAAPRSRCWAPTRPARPSPARRPARPAGPAGRGHRRAPG